MLREINRNNPEDAQDFKAPKAPRNIDEAGVAHFGIYIDPAADNPMFNIPGNKNQGDK